MSDRKLLLQTLQDHLVPVILKDGFEQVPLPKEISSPETKAAFPFGLMRRKKGRDFELIEIQLDKGGAPKFVVNFGIAPSEGVNLPWGHLAQDKLGVSALPEAYRLYSSATFAKWFSPPLIAPLSGKESKVQKAVDHAAGLYQEIKVWFANRSVGPHMRKFGYPSKSSG